MHLQFWNETLYFYKEMYTFFLIIFLSVCSKESGLGKRFTFFLVAFSISADFFKEKFFIPLAAAAVYFFALIWGDLFLKEISYRDFERILYL